MKPYHDRPYPILHKHTAVLMKESKRLCVIEVLEWQPSLRWVSSTFIIPKKTSTVDTISKFLKKHIVRTPYPIPQISTTLQELEGFTYVTALCRAHGNNLYGRWRKYIHIRWIHWTDEFLYMNSYMWIHILIEFMWNPHRFLISSIGVESATMAIGLPLRVDKRLF